jgi:hypothetical protein
MNSYDNYIKQFYPANLTTKISNIKVDKINKLKNNNKLDKSINLDKPVNVYKSVNLDNFDKVNNIGKKEQDMIPCIDDKFEIKYTKNDNQVFVLTGGDFHKTKQIIGGVKNTTKQPTDMLAQVKKAFPVKNKPTKKLRIIYIACLSDDRDKSNLISTLKKKYSNDDTIGVFGNNISSKKILKSNPNIEIAIIIGRNYLFNNNKIKLEKPESKILLYLPNNSLTLDHLKSTFVSGNQYLYDQMKPVNYFDTENKKKIRLENDKIVGTYLDSKLSQLTNIYVKNGYTKLGRTYKELYEKINSLKKLSNSKITGGDKEDEINQNIVEYYENIYNPYEYTYY